MDKAYLTAHLRASIYIQVLKLLKLAAQDGKTGTRSDGFRIVLPTWS